MRTVDGPVDASHVVELELLDGSFPGSARASASLAANATTAA